MASDRDTRRIQTRARVQVTLEIDVSDTWGPDCDLGQVFKQASDSAIGVLRGVFNLGDGLVCSPAKGHVPPADQHRVRLVGDPDVLVITHREDRP